MTPYYDEQDVTLYHCSATSLPLADGSVQCAVTSPPYWQKRDYEVEGQIGLEETPEEYIAAIVASFCEVYRVLRVDGTLWLVIGDTMRGGELVGIPWRVALALRSDGWRLRSEVIWNKTSAMPESANDRPSRSHEQVFMLTKVEEYYYDAAAIAEPSAPDRPQRRRAIELAAERGLTDEHVRAIRSCGIADVGKALVTTTGAGRNVERVKVLAAEAKAVLGGYYREFLTGETRNKRSVWTIPTSSFDGAHFATFPQDLIEPCILAGSRPGDLVLDPFNGSGTTGAVCQKWGRRYVGVDLNREYLDLSRERFRQQVLFGASA